MVKSIRALQNMGGATLGKSDSKRASQLQGRTARVFSRNSLGKTMEITLVIFNIF